MAGFDTALRFVLAHEGGYSDDPNDPGGATNLGITQRVYDAWRDKRRNPRQSVRHITNMEAAGIYRAEYWQPVKGDLLPAAVALSVFDFAVNAGVKQAIETLQREAGVIPDGVIGPKTLAAVRAMDPKELARFICNERMAFYHGIVRRNPSQEKFLRGWTNRVDALRAEIEKL